MAAAPPTPSISQRGTDGRFEQERAPLAAVALHDTSALTAIGNDYGFEQIFERQVRGLDEERCVIALSTSGNRRTYCARARAAREKGLVRIGFTGAKGGECSRAAYLYCGALRAHIQSNQFNRRRAYRVWPGERRLGAGS